jgi:hypothetical protein
VIILSLTEPTFDGGNGALVKEADDPSGFFDGVIEGVYASSKVA